jgi:hypothetical protein
MFLRVFPASDAVRHELFERIVQRADAHDGAFSRNWVVEASGNPLLAFRIGSKIAGGEALTIAAAELRDLPDLLPLGTLYSRVTRHLWTELIADYEDENPDKRGAVA